MESLDLIFPKFRIWCENVQGGINLTNWFLEAFHCISNFSPKIPGFHPSPSVKKLVQLGHFGRRSPISQLPDLRLEKLREQEEAEQRRREAQAQHEQRMKRQESERWNSCSPASKLFAFPWNLWSIWNQERGNAITSYQLCFFGQASPNMRDKAIHKGHSCPHRPCSSTVRKYTDLVFKCSTVTSES